MSNHAIATPHPDRPGQAITCAVVTISDTRNAETDRSGQLIQALLSQANHHLGEYCILPDDPEQVRHQLTLLGEKQGLEAIIFNGGTGIAPRDTTYEAIAAVLEKTLPGFGELFRYLSYQEIGSRAMASRAIGGVYRSKLIFSIPGSTGAVKLAMEKLILPELVHLVDQLRP